MNSYPDIQRVDVYSPKISDRLEFEVTREHGIWNARTLRLTKGRVMRAPNSSAPAPKLETISFQAQTYDELITKCEERFESETGEKAETMDSRYVNNRVEDWKIRLANLFDFFERQLSDSSFSVSKSSTVIMNKELMQKFFIKPVELQSMHVLRDGNTILMLKPKGLWIVGANGRVDLMTPTDSYFLIDTAEFGRKSKWVIHDRRRNQTPLTASVIHRVLADERVW
jgi:hypothetical protein